ncbi:MAG: transporter ATP-binding protein putative oligo/dipeptide transport protein (modular protein) [Acidimicrobiaceae bacterium]|nr:transporter ATP-binding protein putative oligo/dipeptide transport protein (modular protein) [Acidimicrobiaceae bacterium]
MTFTVPPLVGEQSSRPAVRQGLLRRLVRRPLAVAALVYLVVVVILAVLAPAVAPYGPESTDLAKILQGPSAAHLLGTDAIGRDVLSRLLFGARPALLGVLIATATAVVIAVPVGIAAAMYRRADRLVSPVVDVIMSIPAIAVLLMVLATFGQNLSAAMVALGVLTAPGMTRVIRGAALAVVEEPYIEAARVFGLRGPAIAARHVLPRIIGPLLVNGSLVASAALITETGLNFLGLGVHPPDPSWGSLVSDGAAAMDQSVWLLFIAGCVVAVTVVAFVLLGDALRDTAAETWSGRRERTRPERRQRLGRASATHAPTDGAGEGVDSDALLAVRDLTVAFPGPSRTTLEVLQHVSFDVGRGETVGIVGESGCGKTMTGLAVIGMLPPRASVVAGQILLAGRDVLAMPRKTRARLRGGTIAFVSQEPMVALDPLFTVGYQISEAVRRYEKASRSAVRRIAIELLERVRISEPEKVAKLYPHEISGGMAQRVCIAIALAGHPDLLVADEPTTALDVTVQAEILALLASLQRDTGMAIILISHDWEVIRRMSARAVVMYAGQVVERGVTAELMRHPSHPYTEGLLAADPHLARPGTRLRTIPGAVPQPEDWPVGCHFAARCQYATAECSRQAIPLLRAEDNRWTRCIHFDRFRVRAAAGD